MEHDALISELSCCVHIVSNYNNHPSWFETTKRFPELELELFIKTGDRLVQENEIRLIN